MDGDGVDYTHMLTSCSLLSLSCLLSAITHTHPVCAHPTLQVGNGWIPCLEFSEESYAYVANTNTVRFGPVSNVSSRFNVCLLCCVCGGSVCWRVQPAPCARAACWRGGG